MGYSANLHSALKTVISATWTEIVDGVSTVAGSIHRATAINRENWENLLAGDELVAPFVVIDYGAAEPEDWAVDTECYRQTITIYYVCNLNETAAQINPLDPSDGYKIEEYMDGKLESLKTALLKYTGNAFQMAGQDIVADSGDANPANLAFYQNQSPKFAGALTFSPLVGQTL